MDSGRMVAIERFPLGCSSADVLVAEALYPMRIVQKLCDLFPSTDRVVRPALKQQRRSFAIPLFSSTQTVTWRMPRSSIRSGG
jgi:hypothetical protein